MKNKYYTIKNASEAGQKVIWKQLHIDSEMTGRNKEFLHTMGLECYHLYETVLAHGIRKRISRTINDMEPVSLDQSALDILDAMYSIKPIQATYKVLQRSAITILEIDPGLRSQTCLGWSDFEDKSKDPNWYSGAYILPDGNTYTIIKKSNRVSIYPGDGDHCFDMDESKAPICDFYINPVVWAKKFYKQ